MVQLCKVHRHTYIRVSWVNTYVHTGRTVTYDYIQLHHVAKTCDHTRDRTGAAAVRQAEFIFFCSMRMHMRRCQDASPLDGVVDRAFLRGQTFFSSSYEECGIWSWKMVFFFFRY